MPRRVFDGHQLERAVAQQRTDDLRTPPEAKPCLMDVVRTFAEHIDARKQLKWTDPMIAALLTEAGYPVSAGTLRSYRKRLRDAKGMPSPGKGSDPPAPRDVASVAPIPPSTPAPIENGPSIAPPSHPKRSLPNKAASTDTFSIRGSSLPPSRA